jgi:methionyl-tRNA formyltransferase
MDAQPLSMVFLTNGSIRAMPVLEAMRGRGIGIAAIIVEQVRHGGLQAKLRQTARERGLLRTVGLVTTKGPAAVLRRLMSFLRVLRPRPASKCIEYYRRFSATVLTVCDLNGDDCTRHLSALRPDLVVLGGARILKPHIVRIPRLGVLNPHPGLLPAYRGVHVTRWALLNGDPVGATVHFVDEGVDTGRICRREEVPILCSDTLGTLEERVAQVAGRLMADVVAELIAHGTVPTWPNPREDGKQYFLMDPRTLRRARRCLREAARGAMGGVGRGVSSGGT